MNLLLIQSRLELIRLVVKEKWTLRAASKEVGIKPCTGKHILYKYRNEGIVYSKRGVFKGEIETK